MANLTKSLVTPNGQEYEFVGKHWFGTSYTSATTQNKIVTISGFSSADLVEGVQITVYFFNAQNYNGVPYLNVSATGLKPILKDFGYYAGIYEWAAYSTLTLVYSGSSWVIIGGSHADTTYWGKTKLSNTIANDETVALTPKAVYDAGYVNAAGAAAAAPVQSVNGSTGAVTGLQTTGNLVTSVSSASTDAQYPSAKLFYDTVGDIETLLASI